MTLNRYICLALLLLLVVPLNARWQYPNAEASVCFDVNSTVASTGSAANNWYNVILATVPLNDTFWNNNLRAYHNASSDDEYLFYYAHNTTNAFFMLPVVDSLSANELDRYCIYSGDADYNSIYNVAPYHLGFDTQTDFSTLSELTIGSHTETWNGTYVTIATTGTSGGVGYHNPSAPMSYGDMFLMTKAKRISGNTSDTTSRFGIFAGASTSLTASAWSIGIRGENISHGWPLTSEDILPYNDNYNIYRSGAPRGSGTKYAAVYNENRTVLGSDTSSYSSTLFGVIGLTQLAHVRNASAEFDWSIAAKYHDQTNDWAVWNTTYDFINSNISVLAPSWNNLFTADDSVQLRVQYIGGFDYCNLSLNGVNFKNYSSIAPSGITTDILDNTLMSIGDNEIIINCSLGGVASHRYWYFTKTGTSAEDLFENAFNISISSLCAPSVINALSVCDEYYKLNTYYNFSAVSCQGLDMGEDYSCLNLTNRTKNGYTLFWSPSNWSYDSSEDIPHMGAIFYYSNSPIQTRIELYDKDKFMFVPAQNKSRDCEIYYSSTTGGCSYWNGFTVNDRHVLISDNKNNWFIAGTSGITDYNITYSQLVVPTNVLQVTGDEGSELFAGGIFTRANCRLVNTSFMINMLNTLQQQYTVTVLGNSSFAYTLTSAQLSDNISTTGVTRITVTSDNKTMCEYNAGQLLFMPFSIPGIGIDGMQILVWVVLLFATILSAIIPFGMFIVVIINDVYSLLNPFQIALIAVFAIIAGLVNNVYNMDRGIKHIIIIVAIVAAYLSALSEYETELGLTFSNYINMITQFRELANSTSLWDFTFNLFGFIINLFVLIITLPAQFINLIYDLLYILSPTMFSVAQPFREIMITGFMIYFYLKAYEVISKQFRNI